MGEYEFCKDDWKIAARNIFICIIGIVIITPLMAVFGFISGLKAIMSSFYKYATDIDTSSWIDFASPVLSIALIGLLIWYVISLTKFKNNQISEHAASSIATIRNCIIVQLSGLILMFISMVLPVAGAILSAIWVIALIVIQFIMKEAYRTLSEEETWSAVARRGASQLKTSASYTIYSMFAPIIWVILFGVTIFIVAGVKGDWMTIAYDFATGNIGAYILPLLVLIICGLIQLYWSIMSFVLMILGWNNIQSGTLVDPSVYFTNTQVEVQQPNSHSAQQSSAGEFCSQCGRQLNPDTKFCPSCGTPVSVIVTDKQITNQPFTNQPITNQQITNQPTTNDNQVTTSFIPDYEEEYEDNNKKTYIIIGCVVAAIALVVLGFFLFKGKSNTGATGNSWFVISDDVNLRSTPETDSKSNVITQMAYGTQISLLEDLGEWSKINYEGEEGYVNTNFIIPDTKFEKLDALWQNSRSKELVALNRGRLAIMDFIEKEDLKTGPEDWLLYAPNPAGTIPNTAIFRDLKNGHDKYPDFAFMLENASTGQRKVAVYSFDDYTQAPILITEYEGESSGYLQNIKTDKHGNISIVYSRDNTAAERQVAPPNEKYGEVMEFEGMIDNKYPIEMHVSLLDLDGNVSGSYYYTKNKVPIDLRGSQNVKIEGTEGVLYMILDEYANGENTGRFRGKVDGSSYFGTWESADGKRSLYFELSQK